MQNVFSPASLFVLSSTVTDGIACRGEANRPLSCDGSTLSPLSVFSVIE